MWTTKWRYWCRTNLGLETAPKKSFVSKTRFVSLGPKLTKRGFRSKALYRCWKIADWSDWSYTSWSQRIANFYMACSGCQWRDCLVHGGISFRVVHAVCLATNNSSKQTLQIFATCPSERSETHDWPWNVQLRRRSPSLAMPRIPRRSWSFWLDEDQVRSSDLEQLKWLYDPSKKQSWSNQSNSRYVKQDHCTMRTIRFSLSFANHVCLTKKCPQIGHVSHFFFCKCVLDLRVSPNESDSEMFKKLSHTSTLAVIAWFQSFRWFLFRMVSAYFGSVRICGPVMPRFGTIGFGVVCDGLGRLSFFVLQWWEEIRHWRTGFFEQNSFSELLVSLGSYGALPMRQLCSADRHMVPSFESYWILNLV